ncbi:MAG: hypothetical protein IKY23_10715 [Lachnospiraceae bacterium]|nr:hypothetical protein [Lachnospiraceae bacterium]
MKKLLTSTKLHYIIFACILIFNILSFFVGVFPPAGRAYYLPEFIVNLTTWALYYFMFGTPVACIVCLLFAGIQMIRTRLSRNGYFVFGALFGVNLLLWHLIFQMLMGI